MKRRSLMAGAASLLASGLAACDSPAPPVVPRSMPQRWPALGLRVLGSPAPSHAQAARVINLWAMWCAPCRQELPSLVRLAGVLKPRGVEVEAIALADDDFAVREYLRQQAPALRGGIVSPRDPGVVQLGLDRLPQTFLVRADGQVLARWTGARDWTAPDARDDVLRLLGPKSAA